MIRGKRLTDGLVGAAATVAGLAYIWAYLNTFWAIVASVTLLYEVYTLVNDMPEDTISETIWRASDASPLIPLLGSGTFVMSMAEGWIVDLHVAVPLAILVGHFWFPRYGRKVRHLRETPSEPKQENAA